MGDFVVLNDAEKVFVDELAHNVDGHVEFTGHHDGEHLAVGVVEREKADPSLLDLVPLCEVVLRPCGRHGLLDIGNQAVMSNHDSLGQAGRARAEVDRGNRVD